MGVITLCHGATNESALTRTQLTLRQEGFKTDLSDFDLSTSPEMQAREAILNATAPARDVQPFTDHPNLMESAENNSAIIVWKLDVLKEQTPSWSDNGTELAWDEFRQIINQNKSQLDAACAAIMSGPIQFNLRAGDGNYMRLPHLAILKNLTEFLDDRMILALHDGDLDGACSNLTSATRLVTAWKVEPAEVSQLVRFGNTKLVFAATWQALQTNGWTDEQLARLQREWQAADFFADLPETAAFKRASDVKESDYEPRMQPRARPSFGNFSQAALDNPFGLWSKLLFGWHQKAYLQQGDADDKKDMLLFYRDREIELRNAFKATSWKQMRGLPGVTNVTVFHSKYPTRAEMMRNTREFSKRMLERGHTMPGMAAETETERRLIVTALALERYRNQHGSYPNSLAELVPAFLKATPLDFMDGQPLRYRVAENGRFLLYSVGLDCVDNGGKFQPPRDERAYVSPLLPVPPPPVDLVWPLSAAPTEVAVKRQREQKEKAKMMAQVEERGRANEAEAETQRKATVKKLLAQKPVEIKDPAYLGKPLSEFLQSQLGSVTNKRTLTELLSVKQVVTGEEPDMATFEVPIRYDVVQKIGELRLLIDGSYDGYQECSRATNGSCLLIWNTTYDPPGQHALQANLVCEEMRKGRQSLEVTGPVIPFYSSNVLQFTEGTDVFTDKGAMLYAKLAEPHGVYTIELQSTTGEHIKTISGTTSNGVIDVFWDLKDERGEKYTNNSLKAVFNVTLPDSGRSQSTKGL